MKATRWSLLGGNFAIGCGVMVTTGALNDLVRSLHVSVPLAGQLVTLAAIVIAFGAPLLAAAVAGWDRRRLLTLSLLWFALGHAASALAPDYAVLLPLRAASVVGAAVFTPQAAAAISAMEGPATRAGAIAFVFMGWSLASVLGLPMHAYIAETAGWRWAFGVVALLAGASAWAVWRSMPDGVKPPAMSLAAWRQTLMHPLLMGMVLVTALSSSGQFTLFAYQAAYYRELLHASAAQISLLFMCFGLCGVIGSLVLARWIDRLGADRCATLALTMMALSMLLWPLAGSMAAMMAVLVPWGLGCFASNSAQQARLGQAAPALAPALMALNTSAMYAGQAIGAGGGGMLIAAHGLPGLQPGALGWMLLAIALSMILARRMRAGGHA